MYVCTNVHTKEKDTEAERVEKNTTSSGGGGGGGSSSSNARGTRWRTRCHRCWWRTYIYVCVCVYINIYILYTYAYITTPGAAGTRCLSILYI